MFGILHTMFLGSIIKVNKDKYFKRTNCPLFKTENINRYNIYTNHGDKTNGEIQLAHTHSVKLLFIKSQIYML